VPTASPGSGPTPAGQSLPPGFSFPHLYGPTKFRGIVNVTILFLQFGFCSTYYLFLAVSFKEVSTIMGIGILIVQLGKQIAEELTPIRASLLQWLMAIYVPMVLLNFVRTLRLLSFLSAIGNVFMVACMVFIIQVNSPK